MARSPACPNSTLPHYPISVDAGLPLALAIGFGWGDGAGVMPAPVFFSGRRYAGTDFFKVGATIPALLIK